MLPGVAPPPLKLDLLAAGLEGHLAKASDEARAAHPADAGVVGAQGDASAACIVGGDPGREIDRC